MFLNADDLDTFAPNLVLTVVTLVGWMVNYLLCAQRREAEMIDISHALPNLLMCASLFSLFELFAMDMYPYDHQSKHFVQSNLDAVSYKKGRRVSPHRTPCMATLVKMQSGGTKKTTRSRDSESEKCETAETSIEGCEEEHEPTQEEKDDVRLRKIESDIADIVDLIHTGTTRDSANSKVENHRQRVRSDIGEPRPLARVFHDHGGKRIATTKRTQVSCDDQENLD
jgi:hypothetical protein